MTSEVHLGNESVEIVLGTQEGPAQLLGCGWDDPVLQNAVRGWPDRLLIDDESIEDAVEKGRFSLFNLELGVYLFFTDTSSFRARFGLSKSAGAIIVCRVVLFGHYHQSVNRYAGDVFSTLNTQSPYSTWIEVLGQPAWTHVVEGIVRKARWHSVERVVDVSFNATGECLLISITPALSAEALATRSSSRQLHSQLPSPENVIAAMGKPLAAQELLEAFRPVGYESKLEEAVGYGEMDFSAEHGFELYAAPSHALNMQPSSDALPSQLCLSGARYRADLDFKGVQWEGPLPFGITFDDGPDIVLAKVGRAPDRQDFDEMQGFHRWRFEPYDLHVLYSLAEDHVYRVTLLGRRRED